jgi:inactivated superfamily I helicase
MPKPRGWQSTPTAGDRRRLHRLDALTAKFLHVVAKLPHGAVVLPGLDTDLDDAAWKSIGGVTDAQGRVHHAARLQPSAICNACAARALRHQAS